MRTLSLLPPPSAAEFAPFGALIRRPEAHGERRMFSEWLGGPAGTAPQLHVNSMAPTALPARLDRLERHPHAAQAFVPLDVARYLVAVTAADVDGAPDLEAVRVFVMPPTLGVIYAQGIWHAPAMVLDRPGAFAVLMWRGRSDDDQIHQIEPLALNAAPAGHITPESLGA